MRVALRGTCASLGNTVSTLHIQGNRDFGSVPQGLLRARVGQCQSYLLKLWLEAGIVTVQYNVLQVMSVRPKIASISP
jgi:hypothetical protein